MTYRLALMGVLVALSLLTIDTAAACAGPDNCQSLSFACSDERCAAIIQACIIGTTKVACQEPGSGG